YQGDAVRAEALLTESVTLMREHSDERRIAMCLEGLAGVAVAKGEAGRAVRLFATTQAWRDLTGTPTEPADRAGNALALAAARAALDTAAREAAWTEGEATS